MREQFLLEEANIAAAGVPASIASGLTGARVKMTNGDRMAIVISIDTSTASTVDITLRQHDAASAGNSKVLAVGNPYYKKIGSATVFSKVEPASPASNYVLTSDLSTAKGIVVFEVLQEDVDTTNGFAWISVDFAAAGTAKLCSVLYVQRNSHFKPAYSLAL
jgi:hypothetical protein